MKKVYKNTVLSNLTCPVCRKKKIKANLVQKKVILGDRDPHSLICYSCYDTTILQPRRDNASIQRNIL